MSEKMENHALKGGQDQLPPRSSLATPDADLHLWTFDDWGGVRVVRGTVFGDKKNRFDDGDDITTSAVVKVAGDFLHTKNSIYRLIPRETTMALIASALKAPTVNEERGG